MASQSVIVVKLPDPSWGFQKIGRVIPRKGDPWGPFRELVGTPWEQFFNVVPTGILDQALRGHGMPLLRLLGAPPARIIRKLLPLETTICIHSKSCMAFTPDCVPNIKVPHCWNPPGNLSCSNDLSYVVSLWKEEIPVIIVMEQLV